MQRSPSFSRSSSSTRITSLPARMSSSAASTEAIALWISAAERGATSFLGMSGIGE